MQQILLERMKVFLVKNKVFICFKNNSWNVMFYLNVYRYLGKRLNRSSLFITLRVFQFKT